MCGERMEAQILMAPFKLLSLQTSQKPLPYREGTLERGMDRASRIQSVVFSALAMTLATTSAVLANLSARTGLVVVAAFIILLGVPHGALDTIVVRQLYHVRTVRGWIGSVVLYCVPAVLVVMLWLTAPTVFLVGFLLISATHFSGDPAEGTRGLSRLLYGGAVLILPNLRHAGEVSRLFVLLAGPEATAFVMPWLVTLALPWLVALVVSASFEVRRSRRTGVELLALALLATIAPPLIAFTGFFCAMHSARHILRTIEYANDAPPRLLLIAGFLPMVAVFAMVAGGWLLLNDTPFDARLIQIVFVGLAALTVPHMALAAALTRREASSHWWRQASHTRSSPTRQTAD